VGVEAGVDHAAGHTEHQRRDQQQRPRPGDGPHGQGAGRNGRADHHRAGRAEPPGHGRRRRAARHVADRAHRQHDPEGTEGPVHGIAHGRPRHAQAAVGQPERDEERHLESRHRDDDPFHPPSLDAMEEQYGFRTRAVHAGGAPDPTTGARAVPIYQTTSFVFEDTTEAATLFALQKYGNIYSRIANPTVAAFEARMASLEGGLGAVATASGQAAEFLTFACLAGAGDHLVASARLYGGTRTLLDVTLRRFGVDTTFV